MAESILATMRPCRRCGVLFTGVRCKPCQMAQRKANAEHYTAYSKKWITENKEHVIQRSKNYYAKNAEKMLANRAKQRTENPEPLRQRYRDWAAANPEKKKQSFANWAKANADYQRVRLAEYRAENSDRVYQTRTEWNAKNADRVRVHKANRRGRELTGILSTDIIKRLMKIQKSKCACCGESLKAGYHLDHIVPLALGGLNVDENMQLLTPTCNLKKSAKHPIDYMQERGFLL